MGIQLHQQGPPALIALFLLLLCNNNAFQPPSSRLFSTITTHLPSLTTVMAVDRSKFRTCHQTSFCRRHRHGKSKRLYDYKLLPDSVVFHPSGILHTTIGGSDGNKEKSGLLTSWSRKLIKGSSSSNGGGDNYAGPPPILTAKLHNVAPYTSSALTADTYGSCPQEEELELTISLLQDGVARVRIIEGGEASSKGPRWTSDDLVLNVEEMESVGERMVRLDSLNSAVLIPDVYGSDVKEADIANLVSRAHQSVVSATVDLDNFLVLSYGQEEWKLMIQMHPFAVYFFRGGYGPPVIVTGSSGLTHFEVRRDKDCGNSHEKKVENNKRKLTEGEEEDRHGGKEIVGYWEDGLAIYADGTREEKKHEEEVETEQEDVDRGEGKEERRLDEEAYDTEGMWTEKFSSHTDSKPYGPMSVGMEIAFPHSSHLFGLPEHASSAQLKTTAGSDGHHYYKEPYRLYNLDVFEYELDEVMALYGHVPLVISQSAAMGTAGAFWFNPTETFVDVEEVRGEGDIVESRTHFMSESGVMDLFLMPGPDPHALYEQYARLTGRMPLPPMFSLGYHQCRWNYRDEADVYFVHGKFEELDYPYDVLWLDIEHTDGKRYFTWDKKLFPNPEDMQNKLAADGRRMVTIIDPHIKTDNNYYIHKEATSLGLYIRNKDYTKDYDGWCWPGSSSYLDFTTEKVRNWWADQFQYNKYKGSTPSLFTWNDMNEPSVFNGPEVSMQKDLLNLEKVEHREWHNLYGMLFHRSTTEGQIKRNAGHNVRPFVLSRSFFAGSQKYGAIWTGDNAAQWSHLEIAAPMLLGLNIGAISFSGADVGGFFGNTDVELMTRWMQAGAYQPFFRGHAHHDAKRREPWVFGDETMVRLRRAAMARYALLPYWYTVFWNAGITGMPVMRTMWMEYPNIPALYSVDNQFLIGSDLLVRPVTSAGANSAEIKFPTTHIWYDVDTMQRIPMSGDVNSVATKVLKSDIDKIPVYQRGGSIIPRKLRLRRSSQLMLNDPYTLYIALDDKMKAEGTLYMDDETTFDHEKKGDYAVAKFSSDWGASVAIQNEVQAGSETAVTAQNKEARMIERIVVMGLEKAPTSIVSSTGSSIEFQHDESSQILVIRKPGVSTVENFTLKLQS